jgi:hypothetical protein
VRAANEGRSRYVISEERKDIANLKKCDEQVPCRGCKARKYECSLSRPKFAKLEPEKRHEYEEVPKECHTPVAPVPPRVNLLQLHLFHHFDKVVCDTLVLDPNIWRNEVLPLALKV